VTGVVSEGNMDAAKLAFSFAVMGSGGVGETMAPAAVMVQCVVRSLRSSWACVLPLWSHRRR